MNKHGDSFYGIDGIFIIIYLFDEMYLFIFCLSRNGCPLQKGESSTLKQQKEDVLNLVALWTQDKGS